MTREQLERRRDCFNTGDKVLIIKNSWDRQGTIGKTGTVASYYGYDQFTPNIPVMIKGTDSIYTFSPDDIESLESDAPEFVRHIND